MGIYASHGVEYHVVMRDGARIKVVHMRDTDARLLASGFFRAREDTWLSADVMYRGSFCRKILDPDFDVELSAQERERLGAVLEEQGGDVAEHAWFDVNELSTSYDW